MASDDKQALYARVNKEVFDAVEKYAEQNKIPKASAVEDLILLGLSRKQNAESREAREPAEKIQLDDAAVKKICEKLLPAIISASKASNACYRLLITEQEEWNTLFEHSMIQSPRTRAEKKNTALARCEEEVKRLSREEKTKAHYEGGV